MRTKHSIHSNASKRPFLGLDKNKTKISKSFDEVVKMRNDSILGLSSDKSLDFFREFMTCVVSFAPHKNQVYFGRVH